MIRLIVLAICLLALADARPKSRRTNDRMSESFRNSIFVKDVSVGQCLIKCADEHNVSLAVSHREFPVPSWWPMCKIQECAKKCNGLPEDNWLNRYVHYVCNDQDYAAKVDCINDHFPAVDKACASEYTRPDITDTSIDVHKAACEYVRNKATCFKQKFEERCPSSSNVIDRNAGFMSEMLQCPE